MQPVNVSAAQSLRAYAYLLALGECMCTSTAVCTPRMHVSYVVCTLGRGHTRENIKSGHCVSRLPSPSTIRPGWLGGELHREVESCRRNFAEEESVYVATVCWVSLGRSFMSSYRGFQILSHMFLLWTKLYSCIPVNPQTKTEIFSGLMKWGSWRFRVEVHSSEITSWKVCPSDMNEAALLSSGIWSIWPSVSVVLHKWPSSSTILDLFVMSSLIFFVNSSQQW